METAAKPKKKNYYMLTFEVQNVKRTQFFVINERYFNWVKMKQKLREQYKIPNGIAIAIVFYYKFKSETEYKTFLDRV